MLQNVTLKGKKYTIDMMGQQIQMSIRIHPDSVKV